MYPTISHLIQDLFGVYIPLPIQTFGFFVAVAFLLAAYVIYRELKRKEQEGLLESETVSFKVGLPPSPREIILATIVGFVIGFKLVLVMADYSGFVEDPQGTLLSMKGNWLGGIIGALLAGGYRYWDKKQKMLDKPVEKEEEVWPHERVGDIAIIAAIFGFIGAKLFTNLEHPKELIADPIQQLLTFSGFTFYGGLIGGAAAIIYYARKHNIGIVYLADAIAPALMLAYGVGRIGCHLAGDGDWGIVNLSDKPGWLSWAPDWMWAFHYPNNVIRECNPYHGQEALQHSCNWAETQQLIDPVYPTPFYESVLGIFLFFVLWRMRKHIKIPGIIFSLYLVFNGIERFFIEKIRVNIEYDLLGMSPTQAQIIAILLIFTGAAGIYYFTKRKDKLPAFLT